MPPVLDGDHMAARPDDPCQFGDCQRADSGREVPDIMRGDRGIKRAFVGRQREAVSMDEADTLMFQPAAGPFEQVRGQVDPDKVVADAAFGDLLEEPARSAADFDQGARGQAGQFADSRADGAGLLSL